MDHDSCLVVEMEGTRSVGVFAPSRECCVVRAVPREENLERLSRNEEEGGEGAGFGGSG